MSVHSAVRTEDDHVEGKEKGEEKKVRIRVRMRNWVRNREEQRVLSILDSRSLSNDEDKREEKT